MHSRYYKVIIKGDKRLIRDALTQSWFKHFDKIELWNDCLSYDWVLLSELLGPMEGVSPDDNYYYSHYLFYFGTRRHTSVAG